MESEQEDPQVSSPESSIATSTSFDISPSSYLTVPNTRTKRRLPLLPGPTVFDQDDFDFDITVSSYRGSTSEAIPQVHSPSRSSPPIGFDTSQLQPTRPNHLSDRLYMSVYSSSSLDTEHSEYSNPPARRYRVPDFAKMSSARKITVAEKAQYIQALRAHQINTLVELRRIEKAFAVLGTPDCSEPMTSACKRVPTERAKSEIDILQGSYYVDSHSLLTELRGLTRNYPFSSDCLDEAKRRVYSDPASNRSWNLCWLVLSKTHTDQLIPYYARYQASLPAMWAGHKPSSEQITQLTNAFVAEWNWALGQMLRHWEQPPTR